MLLMYQVKLLNACIAISASRCPYHAEDGIVRALWRSNVYGEIVVRLLFDATELERF